MCRRQVREPGFEAKVVAGPASRLEPPAEDRTYSMVPALAGSEIQPETGVRIPVTAAMSVSVNLFQEIVRRLYQLIGVKRRKGEVQTTDPAVFTRISERPIHKLQPLRSSKSGRLCEVMPEGKDFSPCLSHG